MIIIGTLEYFKRAPKNPLWANCAHSDKNNGHVPRSGFIKQKDCSSNTKYFLVEYLYGKEI